MDLIFILLLVGIAATIGIFAYKKGKQHAKTQYTTEKIHHAPQTQRPEENVSRQTQRGIVIRKRR